MSIFRKLFGNEQRYEPWSPMEPYLKSGFEQAKTIYEANRATPPLTHVYPTHEAPVLVTVAGSRPTDEDLLKTISETIFQSVRATSNFACTPDVDDRSISSDDPWCLFPHEVAAAVLSALRAKGAFSS